MKSQTPLKLAYTDGVLISEEFKQWCEEKGHDLIPLQHVEWDDENEPIISQPAIILGPHCFNYQGELEKKQFDLFTKSLRQTMRENKGEN